MVDPAEVAIFRAAIKDETDKFWAKMDRRLNETESKGREAFKGLEDQIKRVGRAAGETANSKTKGLTGIIARGTALGTIVGDSITGLINLFKQLAVSGIQALSRILEKGNALNKSLEVAEKTFGAVFGDPNLGKETIKFLDEVSKQLGINRAEAIEFARSILPRTESTEQFAELLELTAGQARATGLAVSELSFSVREALSGDFISLKDRFDLSKVDIQRIRDLTKELGASGALVQVLGEVLQSRGIANLEDFADTGDAVRRSLTAVFDDLQASFAQPIFEQQTESLVKLTAALDEDKESFVAILQNLGAVGGAIVRTLADAGLALREVVDLDKVQEMTASLEELFNVIVLFTDTLIGGAEGAGSSINSLTEAITALVNKLVESSDKVAKLGTTLRLTSSATFDVVKAGAALAKGDLLGVFGNLSSLSQNAAFNQKKVAVEIDNTDAALARFNERQKETKKGQEERAKAAAEASDADREAIDAGLAALNETEAKASEAQKAVLKLQQNITKKFVEQQIKESRRIVDAEIKESRRREDIAKATTKALAKIEDDTAEAKTEAFAKFGKDVAKFEKKDAEARRKVSDESRKKELDNERRFRQQLRDIQTTFERAARDAALANDVAAFIDAKIQRTDALEDAKKDRDQESKEIKTESKSKVDELRQSLAEERKELDSDLTERLDKIDQSARDQTAKQAEQLLEQEEKHQLSLQRQAEDRALADVRRTEDLQRSLREQLAEIEINQGDIEEVTAKSLTSQAEMYAAIFGPDGEVNTTMTEFFAEQAEQLDKLAQETADLEKKTSKSEKDRKAREDVAAGVVPELRPGQKRLGGEMIGQGGLVSQALSSPLVSIPSGRSSNIQNISTRNESSISMDLRGAEPLIQRIAARTALEIVQNTLASAGA